MIILWKKLSLIHNFYGSNIHDNDVVGVVKLVIGTTATKSREKQNRQTIIGVCSMVRRRPSTLAVTNCKCEHSISHVRIL